MGLDGRGLRDQLEGDGGGGRGHSRVHALRGHGEGDWGHR